MGCKERFEELEDRIKKLEKYRRDTHGIFEETTDFLNIFLLEYFKENGPEKFEPLMEKVEAKQVNRRKMNYVLGLTWWETPFVSLSQFLKENLYTRKLKTSEDFE
jgi:hypothetical protein